MGVIHEERSKLRARGNRHLVAPGSSTRTDDLGMLRHLIIGASSRLKYLMMSRPRLLNHLMKSGRFELKYSLKQAGRH